MLFFRRFCSRQDRDRWIGLTVDHSCTCRNVPADECAACRDAFHWPDGSKPHVLRFKGDDEPLHGEQCVRLDVDGMWDAAPCASQYKSVCKTGACRLYYVACCCLCYVICCCPIYKSTTSALFIKKPSFTLKAIV